MISEALKNNSSLKTLYLSGDRKKRKMKMIKYKRIKLKT